MIKHRLLFRRELQELAGEFRQDKPTQRIPRPTNLEDKYDFPCTEAFIKLQTRQTPRVFKSKIMPSNQEKALAWTFTESKVTQNSNYTLKYNQLTGYRESEYIDQRPRSPSSHIGIKSNKIQLLDLANISFHPLKYPKSRLLSPAFPA